MKSWTQRITAKDPEAHVQALAEAGRTLGWAGTHYTVELVSIDGETKSGRKRFTVRFTDTGEPVRRA